jgi:uncharacterized membrane protein YgdD (TMEM256/DUF423 family)
MNKTIIITALMLGLSGIILGAFAAHGLESLISTDAIRTFETGVRYQIYHALFLLFIGALTNLPNKYQKTVFGLVLTGVIFFSGSIYGLATNNLSGFDFKRIAFITPVGGFLLISGWAVLLWGIIKTPKNMGN